MYYKIWKAYRRPISPHKASLITVLPCVYHFVFDELLKETGHGALIHHRLKIS